MLLRSPIETRKLCGQQVNDKHMNHLREKLVLASSSPRRAEILNRAGWPHEVIVAGIDESLRPQEEPAAYVQRLARSKAEAVAQRLEQGLVLGADTTVVIANQILGQPRDEADARRMLELTERQMARGSDWRRARESWR